ncbi:MAG: hypothetical protein QXM68_03980 [Candidatus Aenigmatarchaeota archaeon]|nr:hypothetical protein [Candidatus Aenigmarchaeota archaeon]
MKFSKDEIKDIIVSISIMTLFYTFPEWSIKFATYFLIISISFILKQIMHKMMAKKLQCTSTYKVHMPFFLFGLWLMILKPILGLSFLVVGSIEIVPYKFGRWGIKLVKLTPYDLGIITLAGTMVNLIIAYTFLFVQSDISQTIVKINCMLVIFNMIPLPQFDGSKIFMWTVWGWLFISLLGIIPLLLI